jgi:dTDP-4-amino-4,6-dideoxygalactose transaminase
VSGPYVCLIEAARFGSLEEAGAFRDRLLVELARVGIGCRQPARALHTLGYFRKKYRLQAAECINALAADRLVLALPLYVGMTGGEQERVVGELISARKRILASGRERQEAEPAQELAPSTG